MLVEFLTPHRVLGPLSLTACLLLIFILLFQHFHLHLEPDLSLIAATPCGFASIPNTSGVVDLRTVELPYNFDYRILITDTRFNVCLYTDIFMMAIYFGVLWKIHLVLINTQKFK